MNQRLFQFKWDSNVFGLSPSIDIIYEKFQSIWNFGTQTISEFVPRVNIKQNFLPSYILKTKLYREQLWKNIKHPLVKIKFEETSIKLQKLIDKYVKNSEKKLLEGKSPKQIFSYVSSQLKMKTNSIPILKQNDETIFIDSKKLSYLQIILRLYIKKI